MSTHQQPSSGLLYDRHSPSKRRAAWVFRLVPESFFLMGKRASRSVEHKDPLQENDVRLSESMEDARNVLVITKSQLGEIVAPSPRDDLIKAITGIAASDLRNLEVLQPYAEAYLSWLSSKYSGLPSNLVCLIRQTQVVHQPGDRPSEGVLYSLLERIARIIATQPAASIRSIITCLVSDGLIDSSDSNGQVSHQLVFELLGLVTMLYQASGQLHTGKLQCDCVLTNSRRLGMRQPRTWTPAALDISEELVGNKISNLLVRLSERSAGPFPTLLPQDGADEPLLSSKLSYYTLAGLGGLEIIWTASVLEHLELDEHEKTLKMFRLPSFCIMLCLGSLSRQNNMTFLENVFPPTEESGGGSQERRKTLKSIDFHLEILYSFCLLFQQQGSCRKFQEHQRAGKSCLPSDVVDPLLVELCTRRWDKGSTKKVLDFAGVKHSYSPRTDFPYLAERLYLLQEYTSNISPNDWKSLWQDRRDLSRFYTLWPALIFGIAALSMGLVQIILAILQVVAGFVKSS